MLSITSRESDGYRRRIYDRYVSAFKERPSPAALEASFERQGRFYDHLFEPVLAGAARSANILEVACGQGRFLFWARRRGFVNTRGFDISSEQVAVAKSLGLPAEIASANEYLVGCDREFDVIVAMDLIEHFMRDEGLEFLEQCRVALRPGGTLFLTTPNGAGLRPGPVIHGDLTHETIFSPSTIRLALELTGYQAVQVCEITPQPISVRSYLRGLLWSVLRTAAVLADIIETGRASSAVYTRVMAVQARRPE